MSCTHPLRNYLNVFLIAALMGSYLYSAQSTHVLAQESPADYGVIKTDRGEIFTMPFSASNTDQKNPLTYTYEAPKGPSWILSIQNNQSYVAREDVKTIVVIREPAPSEKYIEIAMFGEKPNRFWVAVNVPPEGYIRIYDLDANSAGGWSRDAPITVSHGDNQGIIVTNGKRVVVDRLDIRGFTVGSISVYGKDNATSPINAYTGSISFQILFGDIRDSPLYYVPAVVMAGVGGLIGVLLLFKKRKPSG